MTRSSVLLASLALTGWVSVQSSTEAFRQSDREWTTLFDGSSLDGWNVLGDGTWEIVDGAVQGDGEPGFLVTAES
ncbi:MAG: family 16 glycoside hydrolase, partial [Acidobacteriota bacterium]|nr:family 16 glycoside hydrolase [Acidobacteriota bacterium]